MNGIKLKLRKNRKGVLIRRGYILVLQKRGRVVMRGRFRTIGEKKDAS